MVLWCRGARARARRPRGGCGLSGVVLAVVLDLALGGPALAKPIFELAQQSLAVFRGTVREIRTTSDGKLRVFVLRVDEPVVGDVTAGETVQLVQEVLFPTTQAYFEQGATTLVFAKPFPTRSSHKGVLPEGRYLGWTERLDARVDVADLGDPALVPPLRDYVAVHDDPEAAARVLARQVTAPQRRLRLDALTELERRRELGPLVDAAALAELSRFLADDRIPLVDRAQVLVVLGRAQAVGVGPVAEAVLAEHAGLRPAALDALVTVGRVPEEPVLLEYSKADDPALRLAAVRGLAAHGTPAGIERIGVIIAGDPSSDVVIASIRALGASRAPEAIAILRPIALGSDRARGAAAADTLVEIGTPAAVQLLADALEKGRPENAPAMAFALARVNTVEALRLLRLQRENHPDPQVQKACKLALGESGHEH